MSMAECDRVAEHASAYVERSLPPTEAKALEVHLQSCDSCRGALNRFRAVQGLMEYIQAEENQEEAVLAGAPVAAGWLSYAPWWGVSVALHVLVIMLAGLISMSLRVPEGEEAVVMMTELQPRAMANAEEQKKPEEQRKNALESEHETPPTDPTSTDASDVVVPPDILAKAELGDHFETINPERPDTHGAFGTEDSRFFYSEKGNDEPAGGGGIGGTTLDDVIGMGGGGSPGSGGGWGGGQGSGIGVGQGSGRGSFGGRGEGGRKLMVKRHGGTPATENAVDKALSWLARHQDADGHWDTRKWGGTDIHQSDIGCTGLALLAFLGAGHTEKVGKYKDNVQRAVYWFIQNQSDKGQYRCQTDPRSSRFYGHGIATMAMAEAAGMARIADTVKSAQKAVDFVSEAQIHTDAEGYEREGWDYGMPGKQSDTSVTSWMVLGLKSAKIAGLKVDPLCFEGGLRWLDAAQGKDPYKLAIWYRGTIAEVKPQQEANAIMNYNNGGAGEHALLAAAALMRLYMGTTRDDPRVQQTGEHLLKKLPKWPEKPSRRTCFYHLYYGTLAMFQIGGQGWKQWNEALKETLLPHQVKGGDDDGSWDFAQDWVGDYGGRVYTTAMGALCMEIYYRYAKLDGK